MQILNEKNIVSKVREKWVFWIVIVTGDGEWKH